MTILKETVRIHSTLDKVYAIAEDPDRWDAWWVGCSEEQPTARPHSSSLVVLIPFPLTQRVLEDRIDANGAYWKVGPEASPAPGRLGRGQDFVLLAGDQNWSYLPRQSDTEVTVEIEFQPPSAALPPDLQEQLARTEDECLKESLENLRQLCEAA